MTDPYPPSTDDSKGAGKPTVIIKPVPGGNLPPSGTGAAGSSPGPWAQDVGPAWVPGPGPALHGRTGLSPVESAASKLLNMLAQLHQLKWHPDPDGLRERLVEEVKAFEARAREAGVGPEDLFAARYVLCASLDDAVLYKEWASRSSWLEQPLLVTFYQERKGGVRFFEMLAQLLANPAKHEHLLQLMYICLTFGYQGRYRGKAGEAAELQGYRERVYRELRPEPRRELSPRWRGTSQPQQASRRYLPLWVAGAVAGLALVVLYTVLSVRVNRAAEPVEAALYAVKGQLADRPVRKSVPAPTPVPPPLPPPSQITLKELLAGDIAGGLVRLEERGVESKIVMSSLAGGGLFRSGSAHVQGQHRALLARVGAALGQLPGKILIVGHTDNIPPRAGFPSNHGLSLARARAVQRILVQHTGSPERFLAAEGRGASVPLVPNDSPTNRARNRRVEVKLLHYGAGKPARMP